MPSEVDSPSLDGLRIRVSAPCDMLSQAGSDVSGLRSSEVFFRVVFRQCYKIIPFRFWLAKHSLFTEKLCKLSANSHPIPKASRGS